MNSGRMKTLLRRTFSYSSSKWLLSALLLIWITGYVLSAIWNREAFAQYVVLLQHSVFIQIPFILFLVLAAGVLVRSLLLRWRASRWMAVLWVWLPAGALCFLLGFYLSATMSNGGWIGVAEGTRFEPPWGGPPLTVTGIEPGFRQQVVDIESTRGVFKYEPKISFDLNGRQYVAGVYPPVRMGGGYVHILDFGLTPEVLLYESGKLVQQGGISLKLIPPGVEDAFDIEPLPYRMTIKLSPTRYIKKGGVEAGVYDLQHPEYFIRVERGEDVVFEGRTDESDVSFDEYRLEFASLSPWVLLEIKSNPGLRFLYASFLLLGIGLLTMPVYIVIRLSNGARSMRLSDTEEQ